MSARVRDRPAEHAEQLRQAAAEVLDPERRTRLGQYFTPSPVAHRVASMLAPIRTSRVRILDPGAGVGSLTAAAVEQLAANGVREVEVVASEIDDALHAPLRATLEHCAAWAADQHVELRWEVRAGDYIQAAAGSFGASDRFDAIVMNPPYRKVNGGTGERHALERVGLRITNLYTAFLALAARQLKDGGLLAAITPRSFANGTYAQPFRQFFFDLVGIERLHLFESRTRAFADAKVLQENVIFAARRGLRPAKVQLSISHGLEDNGIERLVPAEEILRPDDPKLFLRIPGRENDSELAAAMAELPACLADLDLAVSTGKVVEFRTRDHLRAEPEPGAAPLIRSNHFEGREIRWPDLSRRAKPNALKICPESEGLLLPGGAYVLVRRLTSKEEARRVRAAVCDSSSIPDGRVAFENHLNVFHRNNRGLPSKFAHGLAAYLNSSFVDLYVRQFNGHTQINATDLRHLRFPNEESLSELGAIARVGSPATQVELDKMVEAILGNWGDTALEKAA